MTNEQKIQEDEYSFPYHYIPERGDQISFHRSWRWALHYLGAFDLLINKLRTIPFNNLVDIGTGDGRLVRELSREFPEKQVTGIDYSEKAIALAKVLNPALDFRKLNILEDSLTSHYDCGTMIEVFEHIPVALAGDFAKAAAELIRPGGYLYVTVPHKNLPLQEKHFQHFTRDHLYSYYEEWFEEEETLFLHPDATFTTLFKWLLFNRYFMLRYQKLVNKLYSHYFKKHLVTREESKGMRLFMVLKKRT